MRTAKIVRQIFLVTLFLAFVVATYVGVSRWSTEATIRRVRFSAIAISSALGNYVDIHGCLPEAGPSDLQVLNWRGEITKHLSSAPPPTNQEIRTSPAHSFYLQGEHGHKKTVANIYAISGAETAFDKKHRCKFKNMRAPLLLLLTGRKSKAPWYESGEIAIANLRTRATAREVLGEALPGITLAIFLDGEVWELHSNVPCPLLANCADCSLDIDPTIPREALRPYRRK